MSSAALEDAPRRSLLRSATVYLIEVVFWSLLFWAMESLSWGHTQDVVGAIGIAIVFISLGTFVRNGWSPKERAEQAGKNFQSVRAWVLANVAGIIIGVGVIVASFTVL
jgi:hypothetical protein